MLNSYKTPYIYEATKVPKRHHSFESYIFYITPKNGLCKIRAVGRIVTTSVYGEQLVSAFESIETSLISKYGEHKKWDFLKSESIWSKDNEWTMALKLNERILASAWSNENGSNMEDNTKNALLEANGLDSSSGYIDLSYEFTNFSACKAEINSIEKDSL